MNEPTHPSLDDSAVPTSSLDSIRRLVAARSAPASPLWLTLLLVVAAGGGIFLASVWTTEPGPLPLRTHAAFGSCLLIAASWSCFAAHGLMFRQTLLASQRVVAASMGTAFSVLFGAFGAIVAFSLGQTQAALMVGATGFTLAACAGVLLTRAVRQRRELRALRRALSAS